MNPRIKPVTIGELTIIDASAATRAQSNQADINYGRGLARWIEAVDKPLAFNSDTFCGPIPIDKPGTVDPLKPLMLMCVIRNGVGWGRFTISNMVFETETPRWIEATGFGLYASRSRNPRDMLAESALVCSYFLDNDLRLETGRVLDIVEWELAFDSNLRSGRVVDLGPWFETSKRIGLSHAPLELGEIIPSRIRRLDAPRQRETDTKLERDSSLPPREVLE